MDLLLQQIKLRQQILRRTAPQNDMNKTVIS